MRFRLTARTGHPDFLDLPWETPLEEWEHERLIEMPIGIHRHVVRTVVYDERIYHLKALPRRLAEREWRLLRHLRAEGVPAVEAVGVVSRRSTSPSQEAHAILITEHLAHSMPYRMLFLRRPVRALREPMLDALVHLLVQLHLNGFFWGDCSLSNTLFRRDAGRLAAHLVDAETAELHPALSDGQRAMDVELALEKCAGEVLDLQAAGVLDAQIDAAELGEEFRARYEGLWAELTSDEVFADDERYRIDERLRRINALGYDVEELELVADRAGTTRLRLRSSVLEPGRHRRLLRELVGLEAQDNQARRLLNDIHNFGAWLQHDTDTVLSEPAIARQWLARSFEPTLAHVPPELGGAIDPAELYVDVLEHWHRWSAARGGDMELADAAERYVADVLRRLAEG